MPHATPRKHKRAPKRVLALPDLEQVKFAVLSSLTSRSGQRTYDHAIREFVAWSCSEPRLAFNRTVVLRSRIHLEQRQYAPATINLRLAAVRRVAYEAADAGLLSPEMAAGIRRVKGVRRLGVRHGNWLTPRTGPKATRTRAPRHAAGSARPRHVGHADRLRSPPRRAAGADARIASTTRGTLGMSPKLLWDVVRVAAARAGIDKLAPHDLRRTCARVCRLAGGELDQIHFLWGHVSVQTTERYLGCKQKLRCAVNDRLGIEPAESVA